MTAKATAAEALLLQRPLPDGALAIVVRGAMKEGAEAAVMEGRSRKTR